MDDTPHSQHPPSHKLNPWLLGGAGAVTAVTLAPYALPAVGVGYSAVAQDLAHIVAGDHAVSGTIGAAQFGTGWAAGLQNMLSGVPLVGPALTSAAPVSLFGLSVPMGALVSLGAIAGLGIGGVLLSNWMEKHEDPNKEGIRWSKLVRYTALATSALIALPGMLSGLSIGLVFMASLFSQSAVNTLIPILQNSTGALSMEMGAASGTSALAATLPHLFTCGLAGLPLIGSLFMGHSKETPQPQINNAQAMGKLTMQPTHAHAM